MGANVLSDTRQRQRLCALSLHPLALQIDDALGEQAQLHIVGGAVRDTLSDVEPNDLDLATIYTPDEVCNRLEAAGIRWVVTGERHGTVTAVLATRPVEITTFRNPYAPNQFAKTIEEDLSARDFTVNAMALRVRDGKFIDPYNGKLHVDSKHIRAVGNPTPRFTEDPCRIVRLARFVALGYLPEAATRNAAVLLAELVKDVAVERIRAEFEKILLADRFAEGMDLLEECGILDWLIPELKPCKGFEQNDYHHLDVQTHIYQTVSNCPKDLETRLAAFFHDIGKPQTLTVDENGKRHFYEHESVGAEIAGCCMERIKFSNTTTANVVKLVREHMRPIECGPHGARRLIRDMGELLPKWLNLKHADKTAGRPGDSFHEEWRKFLNLLEKEKHRRYVHPYETLAIDGNDLIACGLKQGPDIGKALKALSEYVLEYPERNTRNFLLPLVREIEIYKELNEIVKGFLDDSR